MSFKLPGLHEIDDGTIPPGKYKARLVDWEGPKPDGWGKPVLEFNFKLMSGPAKGKTMNMPFVGTTSQKLVNIFTALNGGTYDPGGDPDDYVGNDAEVEVKNVTKTNKDGVEKTYSNITGISALDDDDRPRKKNKKRRPEPEPEPDYDDEDGDDYDDDDYDDDDDDYED